MNDHLESRPSSQDALFPRDTRRSLPIALLKARETVMEQFRGMLATHGISEQQWRVVRILQERGAVDASEMAERAFVLAPSLTRIIRTLEDRGLITKRKDDSDGRRLILELTLAGREIIEEVAPESSLIYEGIVERFGKEKLALLLDLLEELAASK